MFKVTENGAKNKETPIISKYLLKTKTCPLKKSKQNDANMFRGVEDIIRKCLFSSYKERAGHCISPIRLCVSISDFLP